MAGGGIVCMKLSVAMITYNHERFIAQAIASVLAQRVNFDYEIIIGEDCSTDGTRAIVEDFTRRYPDRIRPILHKQNVGGLRNIESTMAACRGLYLAILEGDDYWTSEDKLQKQVDFLDAHPDCAISCHRVRFLHESASQNSASKPEVFPPHPAGPYTLEDLLKGNFVMTCSVVLRGDLTRPLPRSLSTTQVGDWPRYALTAAHGNIELMDEIMAVYRLHPGSSWSALPPASRIKEAARMLQALDKELGYHHRSTIRQTLARLYYEVALGARQQGKRQETARYTISCIRNGGLRLGLSPLTFVGLAAYTLMGSWYKVFSRANESMNGVTTEASSQASGPSRAGSH
jgi:glycosyltransferase involved in cell wall biosynthesis